MERPIPTERLILELTGSNEGLVSAAYKGLRETSLREFYPYLDLDEVIAFEAASWGKRHNEPDTFPVEIAVSDIYKIFNGIYKDGMPWLNRYKNISEELKPLHRQANPFKGKNLRERLESVDLQAVENLKEMLQEEVKEYVFEKDYHNAKMRQGGENYGIEIMRFQPFSSETGGIVINFAKEIAKILSYYPREYEPPKNPQLPLF
jgi:hypothetical protein